ncbi:MAG: DUF1116 domain-containing protein [Silicimonas sp.]|nr:DUF1116 domain-containing protein [Silicimonas sp.]
MTHPADRLAFDRAMVTQPVWNGFATGAFLGMAENALLHAGPAFSSVEHVPTPVLNSACVAAVYEGLARDFDQAEAMIRAGEITLHPAQDMGVVTPLAAVVSASMPLHAVYDVWKGTARAYAPINGGARPSLRLGLRSEAVLGHIRWLNTEVRDALREGLAEGIALVPLAVEGLQGGDDCHGRTPVAGAALVDELVFRSRRPTDPDVLEFMRASPSLFLNLWMAATKCMMLAASGVAGSGFVTAATGNGRNVGIQVSGLPGHWFTVPADAPKGEFDVDLPEDRALGAIGDSAVVDAFGLGAMFKATNASSTADARTGLSVGTHPYFRAMDVQLGTSARKAIELGKGPTISLGIIDRLGEAGRLGGGLYDMPVDPFVDAVRALDT